MNPLTKRVTMPYWYFLWQAILCFFVGITDAHRLEHHKWLMLGLGAIVFGGAIFGSVQNFRGNGLSRKSDMGLLFALPIIIVLIVLALNVAVISPIHSSRQCVITITDRLDHSG